MPVSFWLFTLDRTIYVTNKDQRSPETDCSKHEKETIANACHVAKKERGLHESRHIWSCMVVIYAVPIYEQAGWSTTKERPEIMPKMNKLKNWGTWITRQNSDELLMLHYTYTSTTIHDPQQQAESMSMLQWWRQWQLRGWWKQWTKCCIWCKSGDPTH